MRHRIFGRTESQDAFTDLLFNALLGFVVMFVLAYLLINPIAKTGLLHLIHQTLK